MAGEADLGLWGAVRILSSDVANDPIFGLFCYGCDLAQTQGGPGGSCLSVVPKDGIQKRLNFVSQKLSLALDRDEYTLATVDAANTYVSFSLANQYTAQAHTTHATITGLAAGSYAVAIGGGTPTNVTVIAGTPIAIPLAIGTSATYDVVVAASGASCAAVVPDAGSPPIADAAPPDGASGVIVEGDSGAAGGGDGAVATGGGSGSTGSHSGGSSGASGGGSAGSGSTGSDEGAGHSSGCGCTSVGGDAAGFGLRGLMTGIAAAALALRRRRA
jgi:hypothetical protein